MALDDIDDVAVELVVADALRALLQDGFRSLQANPHKLRAHFMAAHQAARRVKGETDIEVRLTCDTIPVALATFFMAWRVLENEYPGTVTHADFPVIETCTNSAIVIACEESAK